MVEPVIEQPGLEVLGRPLDAAGEVDRVAQGAVLELAVRAGVAHLRDPRVDADAQPIGSSSVACQRALSSGRRSSMSSAARQASRAWSGSSLGAPHMAISSSPM